MISEYILNIWIGNAFNFFFQNLPYLKFFSYLSSLVDSVPSLARVDESHAN